MSDVTVPPTDTSVWWDVDVTTAEVLAILRLSDVDVDAGYVRSLVPVAGQLFNEFLAWVVAPVTPPAPVVHALTIEVVYLYRQKDSPPAGADDFGLSPGYVPTDPLQPVRAMLAPYRARFGIR